jgi:hypothetical protein
LVLAVPSGAADRKGVADRIDTLDGRSFEAAITGVIDATLQGEGLPGDLKWDAVRRIVRADPSPLAWTTAVRLRGGGEAACESVAMADDSLAAVVSGMKLSLPLNGVAAVLLARPEKHPALIEAIEKPSRDADLVVVQLDDGPVTIRGLATALDAEEVRFQIDGENRSVARDKLLGIVFASVGPWAAATSRLTLVDGSVVPGSLDELRDGNLTWRFNAKHATAIPWDKIASIENASNRLVFLSDLRPVAVVEETLVSAARPWKADASVLGAPMRLGATTYAKGLGVHSRCQLTYDVPIGAKSFLATIGLDAAAGVQGECGFRVTLDGREVFHKLVRKTDPPTPIQVDLRSAKRIVLIVDPGEGLDDGDLANWADARFLKTGR